MSYYFNLFDLRHSIVYYLFNYYWLFHFYNTFPNHLHFHYLGDFYVFFHNFLDNLGNLHYLFHNFFHSDDFLHDFLYIANHIYRNMYYLFDLLNFGIFYYLFYDPINGDYFRDLYYSIHYFFHNLGHLNDLISLMILIYHFYDITQSFDFYLQIFILVYDRMQSNLIQLIVLFLTTTEFILKPIYFLAHLLFQISLRLIGNVCDFKQLFLKLHKEWMIIQAIVNISFSCCN